MNYHYKLMTKTKNLLVVAALVLQVCALTYAVPRYFQARKPKFSIQESNLCARYFNDYEAQYSIPKNLLRSLSTIESGRKVEDHHKAVPWPWTVNSQGRGYYFATKAEAIAKVRALQSKGIRSIDVGCMQVNLLYHGHAFKDLEQAFEPKFNIAYAAKYLSMHHAQAKDWKLAVQRYHTGGPAKDMAYAGKVLNVLKKNHNGSIVIPAKATKVLVSTSPSRILLVRPRLKSTLS